jgi:hypothetical protein
MAPVQKNYAEPGGLLANKAHTSEQSIAQSMCRAISPDGSEKSACVACQTPYIDIDSERSYWDGINRADHRFVYYSYFGLVVGYFVYYYFYAGDWLYYFSSAWAHQENQLQTLFNPGFYLLGNSINIPKIVAVSLTLGLFIWARYLVGKWLEKGYKNFIKNRKINLTNQQIRHQIFTVGSYLIFNFFFIFGGRPFIILLAYWVQYIYELGLVFLSTLWLYKTLRRSSELYSREG